MTYYPDIDYLVNQFDALAKYLRSSHRYVNWSALSTSDDQSLRLAVQDNLNQLIRTLNQLKELGAMPS